MVEEFLNAEDIENAGAEAKGSRFLKKRPNTCLLDTGANVRWGFFHEKK